MEDINTAMVVKAESVELARQMASTLYPGSGDGMFTAGVAPTPAGPATHYASGGFIDQQIAGILLAKNPALLFGACQAKGAPFTLAQCTELFANADISAGDILPALDRLGLVLVQTP